MTLLLSTFMVSAAAWSSNTFNNSLTSENISIIFLNYLNVSYSCSGPCSQISNAFDGNFETHSNGANDNIYINYTIPSGTTPFSLILKWRGGDTGGDTYLYCLNNNNIYQEIANQGTSVVTNEYIIPSFCNITNGLKLKIFSPIGDWTSGEVYENYLKLATIRYLSVPQNTLLTNSFISLNAYYHYTCYQETANSSTILDGNCSLNYTNGGYRFVDGINTTWFNPARTYDGNISTHGSVVSSFGATGQTPVLMYINYTKPLNSTNLSTWRTVVSSYASGFSPGFDINYTIPTSCWNYNINRLSFMLSSNPNSSTSGYCLNSTGLVQLFSTTAGYDNPLIFEEAMVWDVIKTDKLPDVSINNNLIFINLTTNTTTNFYIPINNYLSTCSYIGGYCNVPIGFSSNLTMTATYYNLIFNNYNFTENSFTYNPIVSETSPQYFAMNFTYDSNYFTTATVNLIYDNIPYTGFISSLGNGNYLAYTTISIPSILTSQQNNTFYWELSLTNSSGVNIFNSTMNNQTVNEISFVHCTPGGTNISYITIYYKDETTGGFINATVINSVWNYNVTGSSFGQQMTYSSPTINGTQITSASDSFCFSPTDTSITISSATYQFGNSPLGYSTKTWPFTNLILTNTTTTQTLYLINLVDSGTTPVTFQAIDSQTNTVVDNVRVSVYRTIAGISTLVNDGYTDTAGTISYYMSPITSYTITASGGNCNSLTSTITPTSNQYNLLLNCAGQTNNTFSTQLDGITYQRTPADGVNQPGTLLYSFAINSNISAMSRVKFELTDAITGEILASNDSLTNTAYCSTTSCVLGLYYTTYTGDNIKGKYYVALNGTADSDLILIEGDAYWRFIQINSNNSVNAIGRFMINLQDFFNTWGTSTANCLKYNDQTSCNAIPECKWVNQTIWAAAESPGHGAQSSSCIARDDLNKAEFNRIVTIFFFFVIFLFILGRTTGYELNHPGAFVIGMSVVIIALSMYGMFTFAGLTTSNFFNQYIFAICTSCISLAYAISVIRRYSS